MNLLKHYPCPITRSRWLEQNDKNVESFISLVKNHDIDCKVETTGKVQFTSIIIEKGWKNDPESKQLTIRAYNEEFKFEYHAEPKHSIFE
jgi:hypothetical protein